MKYVIKYKLVIAGAAIGALCGYAYYSFVGCASGTCPITSNPFISTGYGAFTGGLMLSSFQKN